MRNREFQPPPPEATEVAISPENQLADWVKDYYERFKAMSEDQEIRDGLEPALRTAINAAITAVDAVPVYGEVVSLGADALKIVSEVELKARRAQAEAEGRDPSTEEPMKIDLTPDVDVRIAVLTEFLEPLTAGVFPSHGIEAGIQLYHDWPKLRRAAERVLEIFRAESIVSEKERAAQDVFAFAA